MNQFVAWTLAGRRYLLEVDLSRYDYMLGFHRIVKELNVT